MAKAAAKASRNGRLEGSKMALDNPEKTAAVKNALLIRARRGKPKETFDKPQVVFTLG